jgi:hypothetical protein
MIDNLDTIDHILRGLKTLFVEIVLYCLMPLYQWYLVYKSVSSFRLICHLPAAERPSTLHFASCQRLVVSADDKGSRWSR